MKPNNPNATLSVHEIATQTSELLTKIAQLENKQKIEIHSIKQFNNYYDALRKRYLELYPELLGKVDLIAVQLNNGIKDTKLEQALGFILNGFLIELNEFDHHYFKLLGIEDALLKSAKTQTTTAVINNIIPANIFRAKMPDSQKIIELEEHEVEGDGNCGFNTLATDRHALAATLAGLVHDKQAREDLAKEIRAAFIAKELTLIEKAKRLIKKYFEAQHDFDETLRFYREKYPEHKALTTESFIEKLAKNEEFELGSQYQNVMAIDIELQEYCASEEAFSHYVNALKTNLWLGYNSAILYAKEKKMSLYIWTKDKDQPFLKLIAHNDAGPLSKNKIHMLFTNSYTHFNFLSECNHTPKNNSNNTVSGKSVNHYSLLGWMNADDLKKTELIRNDINLKAGELNYIIANLKMRILTILANYGHAGAYVELARIYDPTVELVLPQLDNRPFNARLAVEYYQRAAECKESDFGNTLYKKCSQKDYIEEAKRTLTTNFRLIYCYNMQINMENLSTENQYLQQQAMVHSQLAQQNQLLLQRNALLEQQLNQTQNQQKTQTKNHTTPRNGMR